MKEVKELNVKSEKQAMCSLLFLGGRILGPVATYVSAHLLQTWNETPTPAPDLSLIRK